MQGGEEARSEAYSVVRCNDERRSQRRRWAFFNSLLFLLLDVARDHLVHRVARLADPLLSEGEINRGHALFTRDLLDLLARHVAHEAGRHTVQASSRVLGPGEGTSASVALALPGHLSRLELCPGDERLPASPKLVAPDSLLDHRERERTGDHGDLLRARVLLDPRLGAAAKVAVGHLAERVAGIG